MSQEVCPFCNIDRPIIASNDLAVATRDSFPVSPGHTLIFPKHHISTIFHLPEDIYLACFRLVREVWRLERDTGTQAFTVGANCGAAAGQTIDHAHIHLIPRYLGDVEDPTGGVRNVIPGKGLWEKEDEFS